MPRLKPNCFAPRLVLFGVLTASSLPLAGCTPAMEKFSPSNIWHNVQPHRLQRWNRGQGMSTDAYFSVADPIARPDGSWSTPDDAR